MVRVVGISFALLIHCGCLSMLKGTLLRPVVKMGGAFGFASLGSARGTCWFQVCTNILLWESLLCFKYKIYPSLLRRVWKNECVGCTFCVTGGHPNYRCDRRHLVVVCNLCIDQPWFMIVTGSHRLRPHLNHSTLYVKKGFKQLIIYWHIK